MFIIRSALLLLSGAMAGIAFTLSCGDNLHVEAAIDAPKATDDAARACDCPPAEPPLTGRFEVISDTRTIAGNGFSAISALCPAGSQLISGSCTQNLLNPGRDITLQQSGFFVNPPREWFCMFRNNEPSAVTVRVSAICLKSTL